MSINSFILTKCLKIIDTLIQWEICKPFVDRVDPERDGALDYYDRIKEPMTLNEVRTKLTNNAYKNLDSFKYDVNLIWKNARIYNGEDTLFTQMAKEASMWFDQKTNNIPSCIEEDWLMQIQNVTKKIYNALIDPPPDLRTNTRGQPVIMETDNHKNGHISRSPNKGTKM